MLTAAGCRRSPGSSLRPPSATPSYLPASGAHFTHQFLEILASRHDVWGRTLVVYRYDESDGFFDHVPPPTSPAGTEGEWPPSLVPLPAAASQGREGGPLGFRKGRWGRPGRPLKAQEGGARHEAESGQRHGADQG